MSPHDFGGLKRLIAGIAFFLGFVFLTKGVFVTARPTHPWWWAIAGSTLILASCAALLRDHLRGRGRADR